MFRIVTHADGKEECYLVLLKGPGVGIKGCGYIQSICNTITVSVGAIAEICQNRPFHQTVNELAYWRGEDLFCWSRLLFFIRPIVLVAGGWWFNSNIIWGLYL